MTPWVTPEKEIQTGSQEPNTQEPSKEGTPTKEELQALEARHKEAADALSRKAEEELKTSIKLAKLDPKEILEMDGKKQNKVISEIYGFNNLEELKLIKWDEFWKSEEEKEFTDTEQLAQEIKLLKYKNKTSEVDRALEDYQKDNSRIFEDNEDALEKLKIELSYISESLPAKERVERAGRILYGDTKNYVDKTTETYLSMQDKWYSAWANAQRVETKDTSFADFAREWGFLK